MLLSTAGRGQNRPAVHCSSCPVMAVLPQRRARSVAVELQSWGILGQTLSQTSRLAARSQRSRGVVVLAVKDGAKLDRPLRVAVVGGGPGGASAADTLASNGIETYLFERKLDNCKVSVSRQQFYATRAGRN